MAGKKINSKTKTESFPVHFTENERDFIEQMAGRFRLNKSEIIRCSVRFAAPKFLSGEINILTLTPEATK